MSDPPFKIDPQYADRNTGFVIRAHDPALGTYRTADVSELDNESLLIWLRAYGQGANLVGELLGRGPLAGSKEYSEAMKKADELIGGRKPKKGGYRQ